MSLTGSSRFVPHLMTLVVFLRGANVGGYRRLRPSILAKELRSYDVVNVGATGTFVVRKPGPRRKFCSDLLRRLRFEAKVVVCNGSDILQLEKKDPFRTTPPHPQVVQFVSVLSERSRALPRLPLNVPSDDEWFVRILEATDRFVFGVYRRHMKTIGYLGQIDKLFGSPATTRSWKTMMTVVAILKAEKPDLRR
jgi:hypothetical protein